MIHIPIADVNVSKWKREECEAVRNYSHSHDDERLKPIQRDRHIRVRDVYSDQSQRVCFNHFLILRLLFRISL